MKTPRQAKKIVETMLAEYPDAACSLTGEKDYELLFAVRLSAQCTDERVNKVTPALFERFPTLEDFAAADVAEIEEYIHSCGFFRGKARDISQCSKILLEKHNGRVPDTMEELTALPGVGRKTANLILGDIYNVPGSIVVDTHCIRITNLIGLVDNMKDPVKIEHELRKVLPAETSSTFCHCIVLHGRAVCVANRPKCSVCCLKKLCDHGKTVKE